MYMYCISIRYAMPRWPLLLRRPSTPLTAVPAWNKWGAIRELVHVRLTPRSPRLELSFAHSPPCLINEYYPLALRLTNREAGAIGSITLDIGLIDDSPSLDEHSSKFPISSAFMSEVLILSNIFNSSLPEYLCILRIFKFSFILCYSFDCESCALTIRIGFKWNSLLYSYVTCKQMFIFSAHLPGHA